MDGFFGINATFGHCFVECKQWLCNVLEMEIIRRASIVKYVVDFFYILIALGWCYTQAKRQIKYIF